jgi:hypothetical protein
MDNTLIDYNNNDVMGNSFTSEKWKLSEKPLSPVEYARNQILVNLGENVISSNDLNTNLIIIGDYCYLLIRDKLIKPLKLQPIKNKNNKINNKINSKTKIILDNIQSSIDLKINEILNYFKTNISLIDYNFLMKRYNYIEFRFIILMKFIEINIESKNKENLKELLIAIKKIKNTLKNPNIMFNKIANIETFNYTISQQAIDDLYFKASEIEKIKNFNLNIVDIANTNPKLIFETKYDSTLSVDILKPYETQIDVMNIIKDNLNNGFNINYKTIQGGGKTSLILSIAKFIKHTHENIKIIFCCSDMLEAVRVQVAKIMFNFNINFGIGTGSKNTNNQYVYELKNSWSCASIGKILKPMFNLTLSQTINYKKIEVCDIVICDYISTLLMLKENEQLKKYEKENNVSDYSYNYLLFFDEPTYACGSINNIIDIMTQILYHAPNKLILSSATLPPLDEMTQFNEFFKNKYVNSVLSDIKSNKVLIGCLIRNYNGNILTPHNDCETREQLQHFITKISEKPLIGKFYTLIYLINLNNFLMQYNENLNLDEIENFNHSHIMNNILLLFKKIINNPNIPYEEFLNIKCGISENFTVDYSKLLTKDSYKYLGGCLISVDNPLDYVMTNFYPIVEKIKLKLGINSIGEEYDLYLNSVNNIQLKIEMLNKNFDKSEQNYDNELCEIYKSVYSLKFNDIFEIGTKEHLNSFANNIDYDDTLLKSKINREQLNINEFNIDDNLKFLLYMGVGIYSNSYKSNYRDKVLELLNDKKLAYFIADDSYIYGGNGPLSNIIIDDSIGNKLNDNELSQLIGRTGRVGQSWISKIYVQNNTFDKLRLYFQNIDSVGIESININNTFRNTCIRENNITNNTVDIIDKTEKIKDSLNEYLKSIKLHADVKIDKNNLKTEINETKNEEKPKLFIKKTHIQQETIINNNHVKTYQSCEKVEINSSKSNIKINTWRRSETIINNNVIKSNHIIKTNNVINNINSDNKNKTNDEYDVLLSKYKF